ncbi:MAG: heme-binding domain-containing protein [Acidimicrobiales bacterium]
MGWRRVLLRVAVVGGALLLAIQLVPYGWSKPNPPVTQAAVWPSAEAEAIARVACYDCHSNETEWPPYSYVAPMSWLVRRDVERGRDELNFSEWDRDDGEADDAVEAVLEGSMPPRQYELMHSGARLDEAEQAILVAALEQMDAERG